MELTYAFRDPKNIKNFTMTEMVNTVSIYSYAAMDLEISLMFSQAHQEVCMTPASSGDHPCTEEF